jgi:lipid-A-disaccharide synthase
MEEMLAPRDRHLFGIKVGQTAEIMQQAFVGIVASGSATLEAAYFRMPFALIYKVAWPTYLAGRLLVKVKYLGMPNVLADKQVVPEFIQHRAKPQDLAKAILQLLDDPMKRQEMISGFDKIAAQLGESGASERAARGPFLHDDGERLNRSFPNSLATTSRLKAVCRALIPSMSLS